MRAFFVLIIVFISSGMAPASNALSIDLGSGLINETDGRTLVTFQSRILIPGDGNREIFVPPYTLNIDSKNKLSGLYHIKISLSGLGPDFKNFNYDFDLAVGEKMTIPGLPGKNATKVNYSLVIVDDTGAITGRQANAADTAAWGTSASIHYLTRWTKGSLADFTWNNKMGYLENIYDQYRNSYRLSISDKITLSFYPEPTDAVVMDPVRHYAVLPASNRIDLVYGHDIDAATPAPGAELLIYKLWGYGPRWMVVGLAHYYEDNYLKLRFMADELEPSFIQKNISIDNWVNSDTGMVFCGGFVNWLLKKFSQSDFVNLFRESSPLDFEPSFKKIYGIEFSEAIHDFIDYAKKYAPQAGELDYYASIYLRHNDYARAADLFEELSREDGDRKEEYLVNLAACRFWTGDYESSAKAYDRLLKLYGDNPRYKMLKADNELALGNFDKAVGLYKDTFYNHRYGNSGLRLVTILIDNGEIDSAKSIFEKLPPEVSNRLDYSIEEARLRSVGAESFDDSSLIRTADRALANTLQTQDDPRGYLSAGKALALIGNFDRAIDNLKIAYFLERKRNNLAMILMELGKTADLRGNRHDAVKYYVEASEGGGGEYVKKLCQKYIKSGYKAGK